MNQSFTFLSLCLLCSVFTADAGDCETLSPGNTTYYINPAYGNDAHSGLSEDEAWKSFKRVNRMLLSTGDRIEITSPGAFHRTLKVSGSGTRQSPIEVHFAAGRYDFYPKHLLRKQFNISNTNDEPDGEKAIALFIDDAKGWFESGPVRDMTIRNNRFFYCREPVIHLNPQNSRQNPAFHTPKLNSGNAGMIRHNTNLQL